MREKSIKCLLLGALCLLVLSVLPMAAMPVANADNSYGPTFAAWLASDLLETPYLAGGTDPDLGVDNTGLTYCIYRQLGVSIPRTLSLQWQYGTAVSSSALTAGDLVFFSDAGGAQVTLVGVYLQNGAFAISTSQSGVALHWLTEDDYADRYLGARRVPQSEYLSLTEAVAAKAVDLLGTPYLSGGATAAGADRGGLMQLIYGSFYLKNVPGTLDELATTGVFVARSDLRRGDMVFFKSLTTGAPYRVGLYVGNGQLVVTSSGLGDAVLRNLDDDFYAARYLGARRPYAQFTAPANWQLSAVQPPQADEPAQADALVAAALRHLGKPYLLGASGPSYFDCSGLTKSVFAEFGYYLPRASYDQATVGTKVALADLKKGDLVFFKNTWRYDGRVDHVAIYIGDGKIVHAISAGVTVSSFSGYWLDHFVVARRVLAR